MAKYKARHLNATWTHFGCHHFVSAEKINDGFNCRYNRVVWRFYPVICVVANAEFSNVDLIGVQQRAGDCMRINIVRA